MRIWRWLCCRTGHHRETVRSERTAYDLIGDLFVEFYCLDCGRARTLYAGPIATPSRRYALKRQGRAA